MEKAPKGLRLHIGLFGRRNVGKSSLLNAITRQETAIVSDTAGTTTDPVEKPMELLPIGPVVFFDTAGIDDVGVLGEMRVQKTIKIFDRTEVAIIVTTADLWGSFEQELIEEFTKRKIPYIVVFNKSDLLPPSPALLEELTGTKVRYVVASALKKEGVEAFREQPIGIVPPELLATTTIIGDLVPPGELVMLVVPIDMEAPKGRLIMPQV